MRKLKYIIGILIIIICIGFLAFRSFKKSGVYYLTVSEVFEKKTTLQEKPFRVNGTVVSGTINWEPEKLLVKFDLTDGEKKLSVVHEGVKPDLLGDGKEVVVEGKMSNDGIFISSKIITKCPSKYKPKPK
ncbi:cytochrome c maturation protein CcmE [candidate division WOR-3 bacterium]|nr:cytochrome c maturation protein CcmE [candidate division WOR-3 bacterium]